MTPDLSVEDLLRACAQRQYQQAQQQQEREREREAAAAASSLRRRGQQQQEESGGPSFFQRALADMTAFFDQLAVSRALEPVRC